MEATHGLTETVVVTQAQPRDDRQPFRFGQIARLEYGMNTRGVDGDGFLGEDVLPGFHGFFQVLRAKMGRRTEQHDVNAAREELSNSIEAGKSQTGLYIDLGDEFLVL